MSRSPTLALLASLLALVATLVGCDAEEETPVKFESSDVTDSKGPAVARGAASEVWSADNAWADTSTAAAREAGIAWDADSGLTWEEKYDLWIASLEPIETDRGKTFRIQTPFGDKTLPAPTLECAEVAYTLRATFASWYHLPFYVKGWDSNAKKSVYAGHFGFIYADGSIAGGFPAFKNKYKDHEKTWSVGDEWPSDGTLRGRRLGSDDTLVFTGPDGEELGAGAYFDELFLNKRTGYFIRLMLLYFGSVNLADGNNMFHVQPEATEPGDALVERWQKRGIGHVIPVMRVEEPVEGKLAITVASGSMPRRIPRWEEPLSARRYFTLDYTGGVGEDSDGNPYASLGGGIRRWRTAVLKGGRWVNDVLPADREVAIDDTDLEAISARPDRFDEILVTGSVEEQLATIQTRIAIAREHLAKYPASCSARTNREAAFTELRALAPRLGKTAEQLEDETRTLEDYVFSELEYTKSKTCCWNASTSAMAEIVVDYAKAEQDEAAAEGICRAPTIFKSHEDGYDRWKAHATALGRGSEWLEWSEGEPCEQRDVAVDTDAAFGGLAFCAAP